jgi:hypothetical protein
MTDPFEEVSPAAPINPWQELNIRFSRSMLWDMLGPYQMMNNSAQYGQNPASMDVLEAEAKDMMEREYSMLPLGMDFGLLCLIASETASSVLMKNDEDLQHLPQEELMKFRQHNIRLGTTIAKSVVSHMLQKGLIKYGELNEFLGQ